MHNRTFLRNVEVYFWVVAYNKIIITSKIIENIKTCIDVERDKYHKTILNLLVAGYFA